MTTEIIPDGIEFVENPEPRCPVILLLDVSSSMQGEKSQALNRGLVDFYLAIRKDQLASARCEIAIITFGSTAELVQDFVTANRFSPRELIANGTTMMAEGIDLALEKIDERKQQYRDNGINYYRPWLFMLTDGQPTDPPERIEAASNRLKRAESEKRVAVFSVGVGLANTARLRQMSVRAPLGLEGLRFGNMFAWLSQSISQVSRSRTGDEIDLDIEDLKSWAKV